MSTGLYNHTTRATGTVLTAAIYNSDHQNHITNANPLMTGAYSDNLAEFQQNSDPGGLGSEVLAGSLAIELEHIRFALKRITGKSQWYIAPAVDLDNVASLPVQTADIAAGAVTYPKIQDVSATARILGRKTALAGDIEECTLSEVLDFIGAAARGDILTRGTTDWARLAAGTSGHFLKSNGAGDDLAWAALPSTAGLELLTSGSVAAAATLDIVLTAYTGYRAIKFLLSSFVPVSDDVSLRMQFSTNGGGAFDATGYSYTITQSKDSGTSVEATSSASATFIAIASDASATENISNVASEGGVDTEVTMHDQTATSRFGRVRFSSAYFAAIGETRTQAGSGSRETAQDTDAVRFFFETGNIASGIYAVYGYK